VDRVDPIAQWRPSPKAILRRIIIVTCLTALGLQVPGFLASAFSDGPFKDLASFDTGWSMLATAVLVGIFVIEDLSGWSKRRSEVWQLTDQALQYDGPEGHGHVALSDIKSIRKQWLSRVVVTLRSGQSVVLRDLAEPADVIASLKAAQSRL